MAEEILVIDQEMVTLAELAPLTEQFLNYYDDLQEFTDRMQRFEKKYSFSSSEFYTRWKTGQLGDDADFFEWYAYYESHRRVTQKILKLGEELYAVLSVLLSRSVEKQGPDVGAY